MQLDTEESIDAEQPTAETRHGEWVMLNQDEFDRHLEDVMKNRGEKTMEDLLEEALHFRFKYGFIET